MPRIVWKSAVLVSSIKSPRFLNLEGSVGSGLRQNAKYRRIPLHSSSVMASGDSACRIVCSQNLGSLMSYAPLRCDRTMSRPNLWNVEAERVVSGIAAWRRSVRGLVREGEEEDVIGGDIHDANEEFGFLLDRAGLAASGAGHDEHRDFVCNAGFALPGVQMTEKRIIIDGCFLDVEAVPVIDIRAKTLESFDCQLNRLVQISFGNAVQPREDRRILVHPFSDVPIVDERASGGFELGEEFPNHADVVS